MKGCEAVVERDYENDVASVFEQVVLEEERFPLHMAKTQQGRKSDAVVRDDDEVNVDDGYALLHTLLQAVFPLSKCSCRIDGKEQRY